MAVPKDSYLLLTIVFVGLGFYYLCSRSVPAPPMDMGIVDMHRQHADILGDVPGPALDGMEMLRNPKSGPIVDHNIKGPIYNFDIPGLTEGWITLSDKKRIYKISVTPLSKQLRFFFANSNV